jgi:Endonuclease NucS C-terminal domain
LGAERPSNRASCPALAALAPVLLRCLPVAVREAAMSIYERPAKSLMADWAKEHLTRGQTFKRSAAVQWFAEKYPKIKRNTVGMHVEGMSINNRVRKHHSNIKPGSGHDLFYKLGPDQFRLWVPESDPAPLYKEDIEKQAPDDEGNAPTVDDPRVEAAQGFALESDLQNYLIKNLGVIEPGLRLYEDEGITGVEFPVGGRFIDILAIDKAGRYVVIELKVSRGHDRVVVQLLRYMGWVEKNMEPSQPVRGIIVAKEITTDLKLATSRVPDIRLIEYKIDFKLNPV